MSEIKRFVEKEKRQDQQRQEWEELGGIFHYDNRTGVYKKVSLMRTTEGNIILQAREGEKNKSSSTVTVQLNEQEISYLAVKLLKLVM